MATGQVPPGVPLDVAKNSAAVALRKLGGAKRGSATAANMTRR